MSDWCYNHDEVRALFRCFDCKPDVVVRFCKECHEQVHSLQVFRLHKTQLIEKVEKRKLSQDTSDLETLVAVENGLLKSVLSTLQYTEQQEREMLREITIKTEKRLHDIQQCHEKVDKAIHYLNKVSSVIKICSGYDVMQDTTPDKPISNDLKPAGDDVQEHATGASSLSVEFPVLIRSSLSKKGGFWMIRSDSAGLKKVAQIENMLKEHFAANSMPACSRAIKEGAICVATNAVRTEFWRVRIEKLCKDMLVTVHYLDHGQQENIPIRCILDIPPAVKQIPYQAMECCLFPSSEKVSLPYEAKWCFKDLIHGKDIKAKICSKVIFPEGNTLFHVQLTSIGPPPVNINQKVADLILRQKLNDKERPILPKDAVVHHPTEEPKQVEQVDSSSKPVEQADVSIATAETHDLKQSDEDQTVSTALPSGCPSSVCSEQSSENILAPNHELQKESPSVTILKKPNIDGSTPCDVSQNYVIDLRGLKEQAREVKPLMTIPEYVPIGFLNEQMYDKIFKECKTNFTNVKSLISHARFFIVQVDEFQVAEAMKTKIWCCIDDALCKNINKIYREQMSRGIRPPVFLVFFSKFHVVGLVRVVSQCHTGPQCTVLGRGLLWSNYCHGEFCIDLYNAHKFPTKFLESEVYIRQFMRENLVGKELKWEKGVEIIQKYEKQKRKTSVLDDACRMYSKNPRKELVSSQENLSEGHQKPPEKELYDSQDVETGGQTKKERRKRSLEGSDEFLARRIQNGSEKDSAESENWDLEAEPVKVAEIYSNISNKAESQDTTSETTAEEQNSTSSEKDDSLALPPSESKIINECMEDDSSSATDKTNTKELEKTEVEDDAAPSPVSTLEDTRMEQEAFSTSCDVNAEEASETSEEKTTQDFSKLESTTGSSIIVNASKNSEVSVNQVSQPELETGVMEHNDQRNVGVEGKGLSVKKELPEPDDDERVMLGQEVASKNDQVITKPGDFESIATRKVVVEDDDNDTAENMSPTIEHVDKPKMVHSEDLNDKLESCPKQEDTLEEQMISSKHSDAGNGMSTEVKCLPPEERCPSYFHQALEQPEEEDFYVVNQPTGNGLNATCTISDNNGASKDSKPITKQKDGTWNGRASRENTDNEPCSDIPCDTTSSPDWSIKSASPETIDDELSSNVRPSMDSCSATDATDVSSSDWLTRDADVMYEKESSDNEESIGFLPVEPGLEYRVIVMSKANEDNIFCARIHRKEKEEKKFKHFCRRMNAATEKRNEKVTNVFVMKNCCMKIAGKHNNNYRRVLIKKLLGREKVVVLNIDVGHTSESFIDDLRELDSEFQVSFPPQAFECRILNDLSMQDKMKISKLPPRHSKRNIEFEIFVKSITGEIAEVNVLQVHEIQKNY